MFERVRILQYRWFVFGLPLFLLIHGVGFAQEDSTGEGVSLFEGFISNMSSWERGDVLIEFTESLDTSSTVKDGDREQATELEFNKKRLVRFVFDYKSDRFFFLSVSESWALKGDGETDPELIEKRDVGAFVSNDGIDTVRLFPRKAYRAPKSVTTEGLFRSLDVPDLRLSGLAPLSRNFLFEDTVDNIRQIVRGNISLVGDEVDRRRRLVIRKRDERNKVNIESRYLFDSENFVPTRKAVVFIKDQLVPVEVKSSDVRVSWQSMDGIMVPTDINSESPHQMVINGVSEESLLYEDVKVHWFSINEPIEERFFEPKILNEEDKLLLLASPKATNAKSLIMKETDTNQKNN